MGALRQLSNNTTGEYLKIGENCAIHGIPSRVNDNEETIPARVVFQIGYRVYENYQARLESETNKWVKYEEGSKDVSFIPILPAGWEPVNPDKAEAEKLVAMAYMALLQHPDFTDWLTYQP